MDRERRLRQAIYGRLAPFGGLRLGPASGTYGETAAGNDTELLGEGTAGERPEDGRVRQSGRICRWQDLGAQSPEPGQRGAVEGAAAFGGRTAAHRYLPEARTAGLDQRTE